MEENTIARLAGLLADETRARALVALINGRSLPAGELAALANVSASTMSAHLGKLTEAGLLSVEKQGRHRYFRLAGAHIASLIETLGAAAPLQSETLATTRAPVELRFARRCYNHLAGRLAVDLNQVAQHAGLWREVPEKHYEITASGIEWLSDLGIRVPEKQYGFARACLDWSERRHHVSGPLGSQLLLRLLELKWIATNSTPRAVRLTVTGREELWRRLRLNTSSA
jgi:DNA-binding transcriptional ArsR family regulator